MNFPLVHELLRNSIKGDGFRYWEPHDWFDLEVGKLPEAAMQDGFTLRFVSQEPSEHASDVMAKLTMEVEFALEARKDRYTTRMITAQTAVRSLRTVLTDEGLSVLDDYIWPNFTMQYLGEIVAMTFTIFFEVDSN